MACKKNKYECDIGHSLKDKLHQKCMHVGCRHLMLNGDRVYETGGSEMKCRHSSFAIIKKEIKGRTMYELRCYDCNEPMPFFFYTEEEWAQIKGKVE